MINYKLQITNYKFNNNIIKKLVFVSIFIFSLLTTNYSLPTVSAEPNCENPSRGDVDYCIQKINDEIKALSPANETNKKELSSLQSEIKSLTKKIAGLSNQLILTEKDIKKREEDLVFTEEIFKEKTKNHYKILRLYDPLMPFLSSDNAVSALREIIFRQRAASADIKTMEGVSTNILNLKKDKVSFEKNKISLSSAKTKVNERAEFLSKEVSKTENYLAKLSSKQEELLALKAGGFETSVGDTPGTLEPCSGPPGSGNYCDPGFRPAFAAFSFGAPHRTGMSQYGAYGRSKSGQSAETILLAYYQGAELRKDFPVPSTIGITGIGRVSFEENYLLGIYEVPESWGEKGGFEALKAQAVAARSYALSVTNNGSGTICTTEACQVYKPQLKSGKWAEAVRATRGWVLTKGGSPVKAYFASTSGGYTISQWGWSGIKDTSGDWPSTAYEKISSSPWFYKAWFKTRSGSTCGKSNPWLSEEDMADILNAWVVLYQGGGDVGRITPIGSCWNGNSYSQSELRSIGGFTSVSGVSVSYSNSGNTQTVSLVTNKGGIGIPGEEFKKAFNLRAPGYIGLKSSLFNIEKL